MVRSWCVNDRHFIAKMNRLRTGFLSIGKVVSLQTRPTRPPYSLGRPARPFVGPVWGLPNSPYKSQASLSLPEFADRQIRQPIGTDSRTGHLAPLAKQQFSDRPQLTSELVHRILHSLLPFFLW